MTDTGERIDRLLDEPRTADLVALYFRPDQPFAGHLFDTLGSNPPERVTTDDLLALTLLDVTLQPLAIRSLLDPDASWNRMLRRVSPQCTLWRASDDDLAHAAEWWSAAVDDLPGVGPTKAGKLLARKRPQLIPIHDAVIARYLQPSHGNFWATMRDALQDGDRRGRIDRLGDRLGRKPSTLRLLDVAVWMRFGQSRNARRARASLNLPEGLP